VRDLGKQHLKDIQHEHVYELSLDEAERSFPPLKAERTSRADAMAEDFGQRIERYVEEQLEAAFTGASPGAEMKLAKSGLGLAAGGLLILVLVAAAIVGIILIVKLAL
jgi:purine-nucleoside phosphorylase